MSVSAMKITLRRGDETLATVEMTPGCEPALVGRSHECAFRTPKDESSVSAKHARIFWKGSKLYIEDVGSRNGIFHDGVQVVKPHRMGYGDLYALGNCVIAVGQREKVQKKAARKHHQLEYLNGEQIGKTVDIVPKGEENVFAIGLDPACAIQLPDMLVSRRHAQLKVHEDGECWIEDLGSRNGTFVNGEKLGGKERLLKHGDKITIAYFDFRFLDRRERVTRVHAWVKIAAVAVTACVMGAAYVGWKILHGSAEEYLNIARSYAMSEDFVAARNTLEMANSANDIEQFRTQVDDLSGQISLWQATRDDWTKVLAGIAAGDFRGARTVLDRLGAQPVDAWAWKPDRAAAAKKEAEFAARALRLYYDGKEAIALVSSSGSGHGAVKAVRAAADPVEAFLKEEGGTAGHAYAKPVIAKLEALVEELKIVRKGFDVVDGCLGRVTATEPEFREVFAEFQKIAADSRMPVAVREYARQQIPPCQAFVAAQEFIEREIDLLTDLKFAEVMKLDDALTLPDPELCLHQAKFSDSRAAFLARHEAVQREAASLRMIVDGLRESGMTPEGRGEVVDLFVDTASWKKALSFDCLKKRPPSARRSEPTSSYDEMLGIEFTYESIRAMPNVFNGRGMRMVGFTPKCVTARLVFEKAETFVQYMNDEERKYLQRGALGKFYTQCVKVAIDREEMVSALKAMKGSKRLQLVAAFYAEYFTARPTFTAKRMVEAQFNALRREMSELNDAYAAQTDPEKQILLRKKIMETGLPGDPVLHPKWVQVFN